MSRVLTFVTGNIKKLEEVRGILGTNFPYEVRSEKIDLPGKFRVSTQPQLDRHTRTHCIGNSGHTIKSSD